MNIKTSVAGWIFTIVGSIFGAYTTMTAKISALEQKQISNSDDNKELKEALKELKTVCVEIKEGIIRMEGKMDQKQDKKYIP